MEVPDVAHVTSVESEAVLEEGASSITLPAGVMECIQTQGELLHDLESDSPVHMLYEEGNSNPQLIELSTTMSSLPSTTQLVFDSRPTTELPTVLTPPQTLIVTTSNILQHEVSECDETALASKQISSVLLDPFQAEEQTGGNNAVKYTIGRVYRCPFASSFQNQFQAPQSSCQVREDDPIGIEFERDMDVLSEDWNLGCPLCLGQCPESFEDFLNLYKHIWTHEGIVLCAPICPYCKTSRGRGYASSKDQLISEFQNHMKKLHPGEGINNHMLEIVFDAKLFGKAAMNKNKETFKAPSTMCRHVHQHRLAALSCIPVCIECTENQRSFLNNTLLTVEGQKRHMKFVHNKSSVGVSAFNLVLRVNAQMSADAVKTMLGSDIENPEKFNFTKLKSIVPKSSNVMYLYSDEKSNAMIVGKPLVQTTQKVSLQTTLIKRSFPRVNCPFSEYGCDFQSWNLKLLSVHTMHHEQFGTSSGQPACLQCGRCFSTIYHLSLHAYRSHMRKLRRLQLVITTSTGKAQHWNGFALLQNLMVASGFIARSSETWAFDGDIAAIATDIEFWKREENQVTDVGDDDSSSIDLRNLGFFLFLADMPPEVKTYTDTVEASLIEKIKGNSDKSSSESLTKDGNILEKTIIVYERNKRTGQTVGTPYQKLSVSSGGDLYASVIQEKLPPAQKRQVEPEKPPLAPKKKKVPTATLR